MVKVPLAGAIIKFCQLYPEPTKENVLHHNTRVLIDIRDLFFEYEYNPSRRDLFEAVWRVLIATYEHDPYYRHRFEWVINEIKKSSFTDRVPTRPSRGPYWKEPIKT